MTMISQYILGILGIFKGENKFVYKKCKNLRSIDICGDTEDTRLFYHDSRPHDTPEPVFPGPSIEEPPSRTYLYLSCKKCANLEVIEQNCIGIIQLSFRCWMWDRDVTHPSIQEICECFSPLPEPEEEE